jgi:hypothetical protein
MRIPKGWISVIAREIVKNLLEKKFIELDVPKEKAEEIIYQTILEELMIEDRLNDEVREILNKFDSEIDRGNLDYRTLFDMTKKKLVRERNIIL